MKKKVLLISSANPYPVVTDGCKRLIMDYQRNVFSDWEAHFLLTDPSDWSPLELYRNDRPDPRPVSLDLLQDHGYQLALFVGFKPNPFTETLARSVPSFCLTDIHPREDLPEALFRGILTHRTSRPGPDVLLLGGCYNSTVFFKDRRGEEFILSVGRIHPDKNHLELVAGYRDRIYRKHGLPLLLVGGVTDLECYSCVRPWIDQESVRSSVDPDHPLEEENWRPPEEVAALCNRARMYVSASPKESFGIAMIEAMACGVTCVVNGYYWGFEEDDFRPHVYGNITEKRGSILDTLDEALSRDIRIDGSEWVKKFSLEETKRSLLGFIGERLAAKPRTAG